jgi:phosphatidylglycerol:prolipoprotein diacylglycerol transferase
MSLGFLFTVMGYVVGAVVFYLEARRRGRVTEGMGWVALAGLSGGVLGAKVTEWVVAHGTAVAAHPSAMLNPRWGGRTLIGGVIAGWVAVEIAKRRLGIRRSTGDLFALGLPAGEAVGRVGCFFNGCCGGVPADVPWAIYQHGAWRHPTQLYAALFALVLFGTFFALRDRMRREGDLFRLYLLVFAAGRLMLEFLREREVVFGGLSLAQWVCLEMVLVFALILFLSRRRADTGGELTARNPTPGLSPTGRGVTMPENLPALSEHDTD